MKTTALAISAIVLTLLTACWQSRDRHSFRRASKKGLPAGTKAEAVKWIPPDTASIPATPKGDLIRYGRELIANTALYFGPQGKISQEANGLNCQNCHLSAGTRPFANNFSLVASSYPKYRARNDTIVTIAMRINACMKRSMNGAPLDSNSREVKALIAYFNWLGKDVDNETKLFGTRTKDLPYLDRAADPEKGKVVFATICQACHGENGQGKLNADSITYLYPPLWGPHSYNTGAGLYRISKFASFVKTNMPFGTTYHFPVLTDEQAWDVAAFVNTQPHPGYNGQNRDYLKLSDKPVDYPFGPYADTFSERQHKYGPYTAIRR